VLNLEPFGDKWRAFGWAVREIDGHNHQDLTETLEAAVSETRRPTAILCHTVKGKGVSFMEDRLDWHYRSPNDQELERALAEIEGRK
jgi:transketolase